MFGLALVERSGGALKRGTVYVTLGRMEAKGLLDGFPAVVAWLERMQARPSYASSPMRRAYDMFHRLPAPEALLWTAA